MGTDPASTASALFQLHLQHRQSRRLMERKAIHTIQDHTVLIAAAASDPALQIKGRPAAHQHITGGAGLDVVFFDGDKAYYAGLDACTRATCSLTINNQTTTITNGEVLVFRDGRFDLR